MKLSFLPAEQWRKVLLAVWLAGCGAKSASSENFLIITLWRPPPLFCIEPMPARAVKKTLW